MKLVVLDRDGVINQDSDEYVKSLEEFVLLDGSVEAIKLLKAAGFLVAIATNQSGIGRGYFSLSTFYAMQARLADALSGVGAGIDYTAFCPHDPSESCQCRKPKPGMIDEILVALAVPADAETWMVGDSLRDLQAGACRGFRSVLVRTGKGERTLAVSADMLPAKTVICDDLLAAAKIIAAHSA